MPGFSESTLGDIDQRSQVAQPSTALTARIFEELLKEVVATTRVPGIALAVSIDGVRVNACAGMRSLKSLAPMTADSRFQIGCITKLLVAAVAAKLMAAGELDGEADVASKLPELSKCASMQGVKIWHLLSHTSGLRGANILLPGVAYAYNWSKFVHDLTRSRRLFEPGEVFSYEHSDYVLLGEVLKRLTGHEVPRLLKDVVFEPCQIRAGSLRCAKPIDDLGVADHALDPGTQAHKVLTSIPFGEFWHASLSDLTLSVRDMLRVGEMAAGIAVDEGAGLSAAAVSLLNRQTIRLPRLFGGPKAEQIPRAFGLGCAAYQGWLLGHNGSARGQTSAIRFDPHRKVVVAIGLNAWQPHLRDFLVNRIMEIIRGARLAESPKEHLAIPLDELCGDYEGTQGLSISVRPSHLDLRCSISTDAGTDPLTIDLARRGDGDLEVKSDAAHHSLGFFRHTRDGSVGAMFGLVALRKSQ